MDIDAIQQGTAYPFLVFGNDRRRTPTDFLWVIQIPTWAGIHGNDFLKVCRRNSSDILHQLSMDGVSDSIFVGHTYYIETFAGFCREILVKLDYRKYVPCCFTTAYTQKTLEGLEAVERLDRTRSSIISKFKPIGRIFRIGHIAPVAQWIE